MNFGGKCFLGRVVPTHNNFLEMDDGRGQKISKQGRCSGTFRRSCSDSSDRSRPHSALCFGLGAVMALHFDRGKGLIAIRFSEFSHVIKWIG